MGLSFLNIAFAFFALALPAIVLAYFQRPKYQKRNVGSLFILKQIPEASLKPKKLHFPLRLFLELLALALLVFAGLKPLLKTEPKLNALLLDDSMSMGASLGNGETRLSVLKSEFLKRSSTESLDFHLHKTSDTLVKPQKAYSFSSLERELKSIKTKNVPDRLGSKLSSLLTDPRYNKIFVLSDQAAAENLEINSNNLEKLELITDSSPVDNLYLSSAKKVEKGSDFIITANLVSSQTTNDEVDTNISLLAYRADGSVAEIDSITLKSPGPFSFSLNAKKTQNAGLDAFQIKLKAEDRQNAIKNDDTVWLLAKSDSLDKQLLVSPAFSNTSEAGLSGLKGFNFELVSPEEFIGLDLSQYSLAIFHKFTPETFPKLSSFFVIPPQDSQLFPSSSSSDAIKFASFSSKHPLNRYLKPWLLDGSPSAILKKLDWTESTIIAEEGPLVLAGESGAFKFVASGLELLPFEGERAPLSSVLFLNSLSWVNSQKSINEFVLTGSENLKKEAVNSLRGQELKPGEIIQETGPYTIGDKLSFIANAIFPNESDTARERTFNILASNKTEEAPSEGKDRLWRNILLAAMTVLSVDFLLRIYRRNELT